MIFGHFPLNFSHGFLSVFTLPFNHLMLAFIGTLFHVYHEVFKLDLMNCYCKLEFCIKNDEERPFRK